MAMTTNIQAFGGRYEHLAQVLNGSRCNTNQNLQQNNKKGLN
jgi:hypothetical protein